MTIPVDTTTLAQIETKISGTAGVRQAANIGILGPLLVAALTPYGILDSVLRIEHFLAQAAQESDSFCTMEEYASGAQYEGDKNLGNTQPGDGVKYKGRGIFQITGRANYARFGSLVHLNLEDNPQEAALPDVALLIAAEYWKAHEMNAMADADNLIAVTKAINGGTTGLAARQIYLVRAKKAVAAAAASTVDKTVQLSVAPGETHTRSTIFLGSTGDDVRYAQEILGDLDIPITVDANFGAATQGAIKLFQRSHGMIEDGVVGPKTWSTLYEADPVEGARI